MAENKEDAYLVTSDNTLEVIPVTVIEPTMKPKLVPHSNPTIEYRWFVIEAASSEERAAVAKQLTAKYAYKEVEGDGGHGCFEHDFVKTLDVFFSHIVPVTYFLDINLLSVGYTFHLHKEASSEEE
jgi:uncharacterized protein (DUF1786 family)